MDENKETKDIITPVSQSTSSQQPHVDNATNNRSEWTPRAISTIAGSFLCLFVSVGFVNAYGLFQQYYHTHQLRHKTEFDIAWIGSFMSAMIFLGAPPAGLLVDKIGPQPLIAGGSIGLLIGTFMTSLCKEYYQFFLAQGFLMGASMSFLTIPSVSTISHHFTTSRGLATGIAIAGSSMGGVIWPIVCDQLLNHRGVSFGWTMRIVGFIMIPLIVIATLTVLPPKSSSTSVANEKEGQVIEEKKPKQKTDLSILKKPAYIAFVLGITIFNLGMFTPFFFTTAYAASLGHSVSFSFYILSAMNAASLFGRIGIGSLADKYGAFNLTSISALVGAIVCFCWTTATSTGGITVWAIAYGFSSGAILSLQMQCAAALSTKETYGTAIGLALGFASISGLVGTPISGELVPKGYLVLSAYCASTLMAAALIVMVSRLIQSRQLWVKI